MSYMSNSTQPMSASLSTVMTTSIPDNIDHVSLMDKLNDYAYIWNRV